MNEEEFVELDPALNPCPPGSEKWHRFNLGIKPGVIGQVESVETTDSGLLVKGWFFGNIPPTMSGWSIDFQTGEARGVEND